MNASSEGDSPALLDTPLCGQNDPEAVDGGIHRFREIEVFLDGALEKGLLTITEFLVPGLVFHAQELVLAHKILVAVDIGMVNPESIGFGVAIDIGGIGELFAARRPRPN